jgi:1,4-dihydroxy-6-naphthoate synthase
MQPLGYPPGSISTESFQNVKGMKLTLGFSSCPNDTFIFDAMLHGRIDTEGLSFQPIIEDVEALNQRAMRGELDLTKLSYHAMGYVRDVYGLLEAGSALGNKVGPLLIARRPLSREEVHKGSIAIPGKLTTANFLFSLAYPEAQNKEELLFSEIEQAVLEGSFDAGLIIHENRFTYEEKGLVKIIDCGEFWESNYHCPIPLGGIVGKRSLPEEVQRALQRVMQRSVEHAFAYPADSRPFVKQHAQEMDPTVMQQHIDLYVNDYTRQLGPLGEKAVQTLFSEAEAKGILPLSQAPLFLAR